MLELRKLARKFTKYEPIVNIFELKTKLKNMKQKIQNTVFTHLTTQITKEENKKKNMHHIV